MGIIKMLRSFFVKSTLKSPKDKTIETPPFSWGYQQYDHKIRRLYRDKQIEVNNHRVNYMKWKNYMVEHIDGIHLKRGKVESCPQCGGENA